MALRRSCVPVQPEAIPAEVRQTLSSQNRRGATLCSSGLARVPAALGFFKPLVVIPSWALRDFSSTELHAVVLHELAHLDRWDDWSNLAQKVLRGLFFFHPAMWWIDTRLSLEREMACDDLVLARTANPRQYAECLVSLAEKWGIGDDIIRNDLVDKSTPAEKRQLHDALYEPFEHVTEWLNSFAGRPLSPEAEAFMYMQTALDEMGFYIIEEKRAKSPGSSE